MQVLEQPYLPIEILESSQTASAGPRQKAREELELREGDLSDNVPFVYFLGEEELHQLGRAAVCLVIILVVRRMEERRVDQLRDYHEVAVRRVEHEQHRQKDSDDAAELLEHLPDGHQKALVDALLGRQVEVQGVQLLRLDLLVSFLINRHRFRNSGSWYHQ